MLRKLYYFEVFSERKLASWSAQLPHRLGTGALSCPTPTSTEFVEHVKRTHLQIQNRKTSMTLDNNGRSKRSLGESHCWWCSRNQRPWQVKMNELKGILCISTGHATSSKTRFFFLFRFVSGFSFKYVFYLGRKGREVSLNAWGEIHKESIKVKRIIKIIIKCSFLACFDFLYEVPPVRGPTYLSKHHCHFKIRKAGRTGINLCTIVNVCLVFLQDS